MRREQATLRVSTQSLLGESLEGKESLDSSLTLPKPCRTSWVSWTYAVRRQD